MPAGYFRRTRGPKAAARGRACADFFAGHPRYVSGWELPNDRSNHVTDGLKTTASPCLVYREHFLKTAKLCFDSQKTGLYNADIADTFKEPE